MSTRAEQILDEATHAAAKGRPRDSHGLFYSESAWRSIIAASGLPERLAAAEEEIARLRVFEAADTAGEQENERLADANDFLRGELNKTAAENERLRAALRPIVDEYSLPNCSLRRLMEIVANAAEILLAERTEGPS